MSRLNTPYACDPGYGTSMRGQSSRTYKPRIKPEAEGIAQHHRDGNIKQLFQSLPTQKNYRKQAKNHIKENVLLASQCQPKWKKAEVAAAQPTPSVKKLSKYSYIQSKVTSFVNNTRPYSAPQQDTKKPAKMSKNFVQLNKIITPVRLQSSSNVITKDTSSCEAGKIPKYLLHRRRQWHRQKLEEKANLPDPSIPVGHVVMSPKDKHRTMQALSKNQRRLTSELLSLPIVFHTLRQKQKKEDLESKLREIDDAIKIFSRPKVFVKL